MFLQQITSIKLSKLVRKCTIVGVLSFSVLSLAAQKSLAQQRQTFSLTIDNQNQQMTGTFLVKSSNSQQWASPTYMFVESGKTDILKITTSECLVDVAVLYTDITFDVARINVCQQNTYRLSGKGGAYTLEDPNAIQVAQSRQSQALMNKIEAQRLTFSTFWQNGPLLPLFRR
jgi:hypothetical protein